VAVTVAVISFNTRELLLRCLASLAPEVAAGTAQVHVLDNGSTDGSAPAARSYAPWAEVIEPGANLGFGAAVNAVAERTTGDWLLVANADVALEPGALAALLAAGEAGERVGIVAPRLLLGDGSTQHSVHPFPTVPLTLVFNLGLARLSPRVADRLCLEGFWNPDRRRAVPWAIGACLLVRRAAFEEVGGFDERQWMYAEDVDLGWRLAQARWTTLYEPAARVRHQSGASTATAFGDRQLERFVAETYAMLIRRRGRARTALTAGLNIGGAAARVAFTAPLALLGGRRRASARENRRWLEAHLHGLRHCSTLARSPRRMP
jgi:GT2 family glycosyltransferase